MTIAATTGPTGITPVQMRQAYGVNGINLNGVTGDGSGQTIAIVDAFDDPNAFSDLQAFDSAFGLPAPPAFQKLDQDGGNALPGTDGSTKPNTWELETSLDIEWAHAIAPAANLILYEANSSSYDDLLNHAVNTARNNPFVSAISMSFAGSEFSSQTSFDSLFTTPATRGSNGVTFLASTGDTGSPGGYPAYSPNVIAVGGTSLSVSPTGGYQGETGWGGSGGGRSTVEARPAYQGAAQFSPNRTTPDVSMDGDPNTGVPVYDSFDNGASTPWIQVGGTSLATPMWAGIVAIADQGRVRNGLATLDGSTQTLPELYNAPASDFHDITGGGNGGFTAGPGYDLVTGLGSPNAAAIVATLAAPSTGSSTATASLVKSDGSTAGNWGGVYGSDGYALLGGGQTSSPAYAQVFASGQQSYVWASATSDTRAPQLAANSNSRIAACDYSSSSFSLDVNLTDGKVHQVALYLLDFDGLNRSETVQIADASSGVVLSSQSVTNFWGGQYLVWNLSGHVRIIASLSGGANAVASGLFFDAAKLPPSARYAATDSTTQGAWSGKYGSDGYGLFGGQASYPGYAQVGIIGQQSYVWAWPTSDSRALQISPASSQRIAACDYSSSAFTIDLNLTDGATHQIALYLVNFDFLNRSETVQIVDGGSATVLDTRTASNFSGGQYLIYNVSGHVKITISNAGGVNAVASGLFFDPVQGGASAAPVRSDTSTQGSWVGTYGADGYEVISGSTALPSYAQVVMSGGQNFTWGNVAIDGRSMQTDSTSGNRVDGCYYSLKNFTADVDLIDGKVHQVAMYFADYDHGNRSETVQVVDAISGTVLDTQTVSNFANGQYLVWTASRHVKFNVTLIGGNNAVVSGLLFDPAR